MFLEPLEHLRLHLRQVFVPRVLVDHAAEVLRLAVQRVQRSEFLLEDYDAPGLLVATTNLEESLDRALFRRFDEIIEIPKPGKEEIVNILKNTLSAINVSKNIIWEELALKMKGFSAALVVKVANDAAKTAVIGNNKIVEKEDFMKALSENIKYNK